jgi:hypothetical protein
MAALLKRRRCDNASLPTATIGHWRNAAVLPILPSSGVGATQSGRVAGAGSMSLMIVYVVLVFIGQALAVTVGILLDNISKALGLAVFLGLYFAVFVICWKIAVRLTDRGFLQTRLNR